MSSGFYLHIFLSLVAFLNMIWRYVIGLKCRHIDTGYANLLANTESNINEHSLV